MQPDQEIAGTNLSVNRLAIRRASDHGQHKLRPMWEHMAPITEMTGLAKGHDFRLSETPKGTMIADDLGPGEFLPTNISRLRASGFWSYTRW
jgi:hypothetical protein